MNAAKIKVLELLADGKITVDEATLLLEAIGQETETSNPKTTKTVDEEEQNDTAQETQTAIEDFVREAFQNVTDTVRKGVERADEQWKKTKAHEGDVTNNPFQQLEKSLREISEHLNKR
ncbi:SHOCT-like domain-containing protein [Staphylococcus americanisciuri]|uniref:YvlB/LiaX N-terminal domain-containing protein n=1 Tax=Staphylococcus americanisciuri TaxID=2973940 RepID=A0ABT2F560_9STAP|nr:hypothetical protein [Staphylococcus americanisciuri]MCS4487318.1 hypothetical protein [Staphylococcus americanisciuri]